MGIPILILGESGTGKSASMRNFKSEDIALVNVGSKPLPFRGHFEESINSDSYRQITKFIKECWAPIVVIDDAQYLMANEFMRRADERGYDKFTEIGVNFWNLVRTVIDLPPDKIVVFMAHIERDVNGNEKIKTIGKLLDEKITVEGMFSIVLKTVVKDGVYSFTTQNNGHDTVKSPIGMFDSNIIDNDLEKVCHRVYDFYFGEPTKKAEQKKPEEIADPVPETITEPIPEPLPTAKEEPKKEEAPKRRTRKRRTPAASMDSITEEMPF